VVGWVNILDASGFYKEEFGSVETLFSGCGQSWREK